MPETAPIAPVAAPEKARVGGLDRTAKMYIGGKQARPDGAYSRAVWSTSGTLLGHAGIGNRKDIRNAVEAAQAARSWSGSAGHLRAQILYYIAENLSARRAEFAGRIADLTGTGRSRAGREVDRSVECLFTTAAWADKFDGRAAGVPLRGMALALREAVGVIGIFGPDDAPLLGMVSAVAPAIAMGNRVVYVPGEAYPLVATDFYQVLDTSDVPGGVVNIVTGSHQELAPVLGGHLDVDAVWSFSGQDLSGIIEETAAGNLKRSWVNYGRGRDWVRERDMREFLGHATEIKTVWVPYGA